MDTRGPVTSVANTGGLYICGHVNAAMILGPLGVIEMGLQALGIPHGKGGTEAAINFLGENVEA